VKNGRTTLARKGWATWLLGILAVVALGFFGFELWQWLSPFLPMRPATGAFSLSSAPSGAVVRWKGRELGQTPIKACALPPGDQVIELGAPGYQVCPVELTIKAGSLVDLGVRTLTKQLGKLRLVTDPSGIAYHVVGPDKKTIAGITPDTIENLPLGRYEVRLSEPGWSDYTQVAPVNSGDPVEITRQFKGGGVELTSDPSGATIFVGESRLGATPLTVNLPGGPVEVTSRFGTLVSVVQTLVPDPQKTISFHFKHAYGTLLVSSDRTDAVLIVDGVDFGHPPAQLFLAPGNHKLLLTAPNAPDKTRRVDLIEGTRANVQINFGTMIGEVAAVSNPGGSPLPTPAKTSGATTITGTPRPTELAAQPTPVPLATPTPMAASTPAAQSTPEEAKSGSEEQPMIPPATPEEKPPAAPHLESPRPVRTLNRSATVTKRGSAAATPSSSTALKPEQATTKKEAYRLLDSQLKAKEDALKAEKQYIDYQIKNSSGAIRERWKYMLAQWRLEKARVQQDRAAAKARLKEEWR